MKVIRPGTEVILRHGPPGEESETIRGTVTLFEVYTDRTVSYRIHWWDGRRHESAYFTAGTFEPVDPTYLTIQKAP